ncbi:MAG: RNA methyltransferase [Lautropia sp.]|nr:RNA methyltransferase [Lautropia sp.]
MAEPLTLLTAALARRTESPVEISSAVNPRYRHLSELLESARARRRARLTVLEGWHLLESWLLQPRASGDSTMPSATAIHALVLPQRTWRRVMAALQGHHGEEAGAEAGEGVHQARPEAALQALCASRWLVLEDRLFDALDVLPSPAPVLALVPIPHAELPASLGEQDVVILDRVQDPGNVGAIIRTAAAAGISWLITTPGTAACWAPKVLRAGMGGHFAMTIVESVAIDTLLARLAQPLVGTIVQPGKTLPLYEADLRAPLAWVFGNEGEGIDTALQTRLGQGVTIPQTAGVESLNVAAAAAICLFEQRRQRLMAG